MKLLLKTFLSVSFDEKTAVSGKDLHEILGVFFLTFSIKLDQSDSVGFYSAKQTSCLF